MDCRRHIRALPVACSASATCLHLPSSHPHFRNSAINRIDVHQSHTPTAKRYVVPIATYSTRTCCCHRAPDTPRQRPFRQPAQQTADPLKLRTSSRRWNTESLFLHPEKIFENDIKISTLSGSRHNQCSTSLKRNGPHNAARIHNFEEWNSNLTGQHVLRRNQISPDHLRVRGGMHCIGKDVAVWIAGKCRRRTEEG